MDELAKGDYADCHPGDDTIVLRPGVAARVQQFTGIHYKSFLSRFFEWMASIVKYRRIPHKEFWCLKNGLDRVGKLLQSNAASAWSSEETRRWATHTRALVEAAVQRKVGWPTSYVANKMALLLDSPGNRPIAWTLASLSLSSCEQENGSDHVETGTVLFNLGFIASKAGAIEETEVYLRRAWPILMKAHGARHEAVGRLLEELGKLCLITKRSPEAEEFFEEALEIEKQCHGVASPVGARRLRELAKARRISGKLENATALFEQARDIFMAIKGPNDVEVAETWLEMGYMHGHAKRSSDAVNAYKKAEDIFLFTLGPEHSSTRWASGMRLAEEQDANAGVEAG
ncbi:tetratricopeptide repeat protein [Roseimicrobium sp. ORNL1]|uniref:tetratricopeptide repeat protein n=1 Tax=Roseimicrobium sp. ORNL1 TaxID=2711231 RepID=UPI00197D7C78|nr:tetratricopeptide repeat protein [Roseimicrobium sp. ORNL1]